MAKSFAQSKGARAERAAIDLLQPIVDKIYRHAGYKEELIPTLQRNTLQSDKGGFDVVGLNWLALEIKHQETLHLDHWWVQCIEQSKSIREPVLMYKQNRVKWRVRMLGRLPIGDQFTQAVVDISLDHFLEYFESRVGYEVATGERI